MRVPLRAALAVSVLALLALAATATAAGLLFEADRQRSDRGHRLAAAAAYVERGKAQVETTGWHALSEKLTALRLSAQLTMTSTAGKRGLYPSAQLGAPSKRSRRRAQGVASNTPRSNPIAPNSTVRDTPRSNPIAAASTVRTFSLGGTDPAAGQPTATYTFPLGAASGEVLVLDLYAGPVDRTRELLVALASGLAALLAGGALLISATGRWLLSPLRRLNTQVDAIAGGDAIAAHPTSPIREVENVAAAVEGMAARLTQTAEQSARLEAERRMLVSSIAHDLRTPLFSLRGYLDAIATGLGNPHERLDQARSKADQIDRLITGLFDYARADIDQPLRLQTTNLADAVNDATAAFELAADKRAITLRVKALTGTAVRIDRDGFERALANVLDNALRHTSPGGTIDITSGSDTDGPYVRVIDDGPGIPPDLLPRVFESTLRADSARNSGSGGAGLGLTIAARLLEHQGATIHAANTPDRGAILTLRLPWMPA
ncbi:MAG TPA: HAMP domain-containing sensor histidine kinase [Solirubrobacteraceae bacterium]|nr:HAMP domain-containing sensor histidine kinase [Solirubrobacteraceae bacterium]